jgi:nitrogen fixation-related uncharacterized protein
MRPSQRTKPAQSASPLFRLVVGSLLVVLSILMAGAFFMLPWWEGSTTEAGSEFAANLAGNDTIVEQMAANANVEPEVMRSGLNIISENPDEFFQEEEQSLTAWEIWTGSEGTAVLSLNPADISEGGFGEVPLVDLTLVFILIGAGLIFILTVFILNDIISSRPTLAIIAVIALLLAAYPFLWMSLKTQQFEDDLHRAAADDYLTEIALDLDGFYTPEDTGTVAATQAPELNEEAQAELYAETAEAMTVAYSPEEQIGLGVVTLVLAIGSLGTLFIRRRGGVEPVEEAVPVPA